MKESEILSNLLLDGFREDDKAPVNFKAIFSRLLKYWWVFAISVALFTGIGLMYISYATPEYYVSTSILVKVGNNNAFTENIVLRDIEGYETSKQIENEMEVINSYSLMREAVERLPLHALFYVEGKYGKYNEIYGRQVPIEVMVHERNNSEFGIPDDNTISLTLENARFTLWGSNGEQSTVYEYGDQIKNWYGTFSIEKKAEVEISEPFNIVVALVNKDAVAGSYRSRLDVSVSNKMASVLILGLFDPVPQKGVDILNELVEVYNLQAVDDKNIVAENTIAFIDNQLASLDKELREIETKIESYKRSNNISDISNEFNSFVQNSSLYESQLSRNRIQLEVLGSIEAYLNSPRDYEVPSSLSIEDKTLADLISRYNERQREFQRISRTVQPNNPILRSIEEEIEFLKRDIRTNLSNIREGLVIENRNLSQNLSVIDDRVARIPTIERGLLELTRDQERVQENYLYLKNKKEQSELTLAANTVANARIIDSASASSSPSKPKKRIIIGISLFFGMGLPFLVVYGTYLFNPRVQDKSDVERITQVQVLGEITHRDGKNELVVGIKDRSPINEQFRLIRTNIAFLSKKDSIQTIMVTSTAAGDGKSFFALNYGAVSAIGNKRTCIVEFDLRKPTLLKKANIKGGLGVSDFILDETLTLDDILIKSSEFEDLYFIGCGTKLDRASELYLEDRMGVVFERLRERFDLIVIDTAPVGLVSDALNFSEYVDLCVYLVRYNRTNKDHLNILKDLNLKEKYKHLGLVLNDAREMNSYYGYTYGAGYEK